LLPSPLRDPSGNSLSLSLFQTRILGSEWIQGVCADYPVAHLAGTWR
jgi:hypothetical protein